ncbi:MAG: hypothetical protein A2103_01325 [Gammaproteobacteria bacterium GWF2_41_13]|nr:MAG: hypothetical protein A2103_01325 [Gammaproteobacteria bacterium GWF2_41_13]
MQAVGILSPEQAELLSFLHGGNPIAITPEVCEEVTKLGSEEFARVFQARDDIRYGVLSISEAASLSSEQASVLKSLRSCEIYVTPAMMEQIKKLKLEECDKVCDVIFIVHAKVATIQQAASLSPKQASVLKSFRYGDDCQILVTLNRFLEILRLGPEECDRVLQAKYDIRSGFLSILEAASLSPKQAGLLVHFRCTKTPVTSSMFEEVKRLTDDECDRVSYAGCAVCSNAASILEAASLSSAQATLLWDLDRFCKHMPITSGIFEEVKQLTDEQCDSVSCARYVVREKVTSILEAASLSPKQAKLLSCFASSYIAVTRDMFAEVGGLTDGACDRARDVTFVIYAQVASISEAAKVSPKQAELLWSFRYNQISVTRDMFLKTARLTDDECDRAYHARCAIRDKGADILEAASLSSAQAELLWSVRYNKTPVTPAMFAIVKSLTDQRCQQIIGGSDKDKACFIQYVVECHQFSLFKKGSCLFAQVGRQAMTDARHTCSEAQRAYDERYGLVLAQRPSR